MMDSIKELIYLYLQVGMQNSNSRLISHQSEDWIVLKPDTNSSFGSRSSDTKKTPVTPRFPEYGQPGARRVADASFSLGKSQNVSIQARIRSESDINIFHSNFRDYKYKIYGEVQRSINIKLGLHPGLQNNTTASNRCQNYKRSVRAHKQKMACDAAGAGLA